MRNKIKISKGGKVHQVHDHILEKGSPGSLTL
jgi:hypothetical protein